VTNLLGTNARLTAATIIVASSVPNPPAPIKRCLLNSRSKTETKAATVRGKYVITSGFVRIVAPHIVAVAFLVAEGISSKPKISIEAENNYIKSLRLCSS
jgi:hypothetical protein